MRKDLLEEGQPLYQVNQGNAKGAVEFANNRAIITAFKSADMSTLVHETGHVFRRDLSPEMLDQAAKALGVADPANWTRDAEEAFARGFERYMRDGVAPTKELQSVFGKFKEWLTNIYQSIVGTPLEKQVSPELKKVFDTMLGGGKKKLTKKDATEILRRNLHAHQVLGKFEGNATSVAGSLNDTSKGTLREMLSGSVRPGQPSLEWGRVARKAAGMEPGTSRWRMDKLRGVYGDAESTWGVGAAGEEIGHYAEGLNRVSPYFNLLNKGVDPAEAAKRVGEAQVVYSNRAYTPFEQQVMKRLLPFYSFSSRTAVQVGKELMERPGGRMATAVKAQENAQSQGPMAPDYVRESASIPIGDALGPVPEGTDRYLAGFGLMHEDPLSFGPGLRNTLMEFGSRMNPFVKMPLEYMTNQVFFQKGPDGGRSMDDADPLLGRLAANMGLVDPENPNVFPQLAEQLAAGSPFSRALSTARQLTDTRKRAAEEGPLSYVPGPSSLLNILTGVRITDVSPGSKDAIVRELLTREMKDSGGKAFERVYFSKDDLAKMDPQTRAQALRLQAFANLLAKRSKDRAEARKAEEGN